MSSRSSSCFYCLLGLPSQCLCSSSLGAFQSRRKYDTLSSGVPHVLLLGLAYAHLLTFSVHGEENKMLPRVSVSVSVCLSVCLSLSLSLSLSLALSHSRRIVLPHRLSPARCSIGRWTQLFTHRLTPMCGIAGTTNPTRPACCLFDLCLKLVAHVWGGDARTNSLYKSMDCCDFR